MEVTELYYPRIAARAGAYTFEQGVEVEIITASKRAVISEYLLIV